MLTERTITVKEERDGVPVRWSVSRKPKAVAPVKAAKITPAKKTKGVGDYVKNEFWFIPGCQKCKSTRMKMNQNGPAWCRENIDSLVQEMVTTLESRDVLNAVVGLFADEATVHIKIRVAILAACDKAEAINAE